MRNGVGSIVDKEEKKDNMDVKTIEDQIIFPKFVVEQYIFNVVISAAP